MMALVVREMENGKWKMENGESYNNTLECMSYTKVMNTNHSLDIMLAGMNI